MSNSATQQIITLLASIDQLIDNHDLPLQSRRALTRAQIHVIRALRHATPTPPGSDRGRSSSTRRSTSRNFCDVVECTERAGISTNLTDLCYSHHRYKTRLVCDNCVTHWNQHDEDGCLIPRWKDADTIENELAQAREESERRLEAIRTVNNPPTHDT